MATSISTNLDLGGGTISGLPASSGAGSLVTYGDLKVIQVVNTGTTFNFSTSSITYVATGLTLNITPTSASNRILIFSGGSFFGHTITNAGNDTRYAICSVFRNGSDIAPNLNGFCQALDIQANNNFDDVAPFSIAYIDSPATTSTVTYDIRIKCFNATEMTCTFGGQSPNQFCSLTLMEVV